MLNRIKGAIFDMDGTLIDSLILWDVIWENFEKRFSPDKPFRVAPEHDKAIRTMTLAEAMEYINDIYRLADSSQKLIDAANEMIYDFYADSVKVKDGVIPFLEHLKARGIKMCVASATEKSLVFVAMKHCGLDKYFSNVISCADIGKGKDHPDIYVEAAKLLGTELSDTCVFEDSAVAAGTAKSIGMMTVGIYDKCNYGHDALKNASDEYIDFGETLEKLIK